MKISSLWLLASIFIFALGCSKSTEPVPVSTHWHVGGDSIEVTKKFNIGEASSFEFKVERVSLCPNSNVKITAKSKGVVIYEKEIVDYPYSEKITTAANQEVEVVSKIVDKKGSTDICVWLGLAWCTVSYLQ